MMTSQPQPAPASPRSKRRGILAGLGVVVLGLIAWFAVKGLPLPENFAKGEKAPETPVTTAADAPSGPGAVAAVPAEAPDLKSQLALVVAGIKEANQKKDLSLLLSYYSPNFPGLTQRAQSISKSWKVYDYPKIDFEVKEVKLLADKTAVARVAWEAEAKNIRTSKTKNVSKIYVIKFVQESGQWRIKTLEEED